MEALKKVNKCLAQDTNGGMWDQKVLQSGLGGTQRSKIMILGYVNAKKLRTPALGLKNYNNRTKKYLLILLLLGFLMEELEQKMHLYKVIEKLFCGK
jgi:hypothetical protein